MSETFVHPYIPNSDPAIQRRMLESIGARDIEEFYACIPEALRFRGRMDLPAPLASEAALRRHVMGVLDRNRTCDEALSFLGGGCYQHQVPAVCDEVNRRSEFLTAYAGEPYEDHGRFQALFEYESLMAELLETEVVNVPTYDGSQAAATALRMACRITGRDEVLVSAATNPDRLRMIRNYLRPDVKVTLFGFDAATGGADLEDLNRKLSPSVASVYFENPSFLGCVEGQGQKMADGVHAVGGLLTVFADPASLGVLTPPSRYGADLTCGEIQPLGIHMYFGGGRGGFIASADEERFVQEYPSRLFGVAPTEKGEWGFGDVAWERTSFAQRENAKEFVGTAAALWGITAGVYLALMGPKGMEELGTGLMQRARYLAKRLGELPGVKAPFLSGIPFREFTVNFDGTGLSVAEINRRLLERNIFGGQDLSAEFPELGQSALYCTSEVHTDGDLDRLVTELAACLKG